MILSKASLEVRQVVSRERSGGPLRFVWIERDGTCVGANGNMLMAVEPLDRERLGVPPADGEVGVQGPGVLVDADVISQVLKNMPRSAKGGTQMQFAVLTRCSEGAVEFACADRQQEKRVVGRMGRGAFPQWRSVLRGARALDGWDGANRFCVNRKDVLLLLGAMESACLDPSGDNATFIEWYGGAGGGDGGAGLILRGVNYFTGQRAIGYVLPLDTGGEWLLDNEWERRVFAQSAGRRKTKKRRIQ